MGHILTRRQKGKPAPPTASPVYSVTQAQLDRIASPPATYYRSYLKWWVRFLDTREYPSERLLAEVYALGAEMAELKRLLKAPPEGWTGADWTKHHEKLLKREGMSQAIQEALGRRERAERLLQRRGGSISLPGPESSISPADADPWDPFAGE